MNIKNNNIHDIYQSLIENYSYDIMYEPIDIDVKNIELDEESLNNNFKKIVVNHNYDGKYYKEPRIIKDENINDDYNEKYYKDVMMNYKYKENQDNDPLEDLRKAENYAETLETELLKLASEYEKLVIANTNLHNSLKQNSNEKINELSLKIKRLEKEIIAKNILNSNLQGQINLVNQTLMHERPSSNMFNKNLKRTRNNENLAFHFDPPTQSLPPSSLNFNQQQPPIIPPQSPYKFQ